MMETILIWLGSGFAFAIGVFVGAWAMSSIGKKLDKETHLPTKLLEERNELSLRQVKTLTRIAEALESRNANK